jgi:hypothetical protein
MQKLSDRDFEDAVFAKINRMHDAILPSNPRSCFSCDKVHPNASCNKRICPDIRGKYAGKRFVADCKRYAPTTPISDDQVDQITNYRKGTRSSIGIIIAIHDDSCSDEIRKALKRNQCYFIAVGNDGNWETTLAKKFKACFPKPQ